jgi:hypothetical protein
MRLHCVRGQDQISGDFFVGAKLSQSLEDLRLASGERQNADGSGAISLAATELQGRRHREIGH